LRDITSQEFLSNFFVLKGNHEIEKINKLRDIYAQNPNLEIWSEPKVAATLKILDIWIIEAEDNDFEKARSVASSAVEILHSTDWDLECIDLFAHVVEYADDYQSLIMKAIDALIEHKKDKRCVTIELNLHTVMTHRTMRDIFYEPNQYGERSGQLRGIFEVSYGRILAMSQGGTKYPTPVAVAAIRHGSITGDVVKVNKGFEILKKAKRKDVIRIQLKEIQDYALDPTWRTLEPFMKMVRYSQYKIV